MEFKGLIFKEEKPKRLLRPIGEEVEATNFPCKQCNNPGSPVPPEGKGGLCLVGMCPGAEEQKLGRPFIGRSGQLLREVLRDVGFSEDELYFTNVVKCRLTNDRGSNREPTSKEMKNCGKFLLQEIKETNPKLIVLLGDTALKFFFNRGPLSKYRGMVLPKGDYQFFVTFHPAYLLRLGKSSEEYRLWKRDFESIYRLVNNIKVVCDEVSKVVCETNLEAENRLNRLLIQTDKFVLDVESWAPKKGKEKTALDPWSPGFRIELISFSYFLNGKWVAFCIPLEHPESKLTLSDGVKSLGEFFDKCKHLGKKAIGQNIKWDLKVLDKRFGFDIKPYFDTLNARSLVAGGRGHSLERMSIDYLGADSYKQVLRQQLSGNKEAPLSELADMCMDDCINTFKLANLFEDQLKEIDAAQIKKNHKRKWTICRYNNEIIVPGIKVLKKMELRGMPVNIDYVQELKIELEKELKSLKETIFSYPEMSGHEDLKLSSSYDLNEVLFDIFKFNSDGLEKTVAGYSVDKAAIDRLVKQHAHPILSNIQDFKTYTKLHSTYVLPYLQVHIKSDGRVHGTFNQHVARTGRLSMENPNLQNLPVRIGPLILNMFQAPEGWQFLVADYSQIELRCLAAASHDPHMIQAFKSNEDIHKATAAEINGISIDQVTPEQREKAKTINFGIVYGLQDEGLAETLGISVEAAQGLRKGYFSRFLGIEEYIKERKAEYKKYGYVETLFGRRVYISGKDENHNERVAVNAPIQGTATDINQLSLIDVDEVIEYNEMKMGGIDVIHDAQVYEVPEDEVDEAKIIVVETMEGLDLDFMVDVSLKVDIGIGKDLGTAKKG